MKHLAIAFNAFVAVNLILAVVLSNTWHERYPWIVSCLWFATVVMQGVTINNYRRAIATGILQFARK